MKRIRITLRYDAYTIHPIHRFVADHEAFDSSQLLYGNFTGEDEHVLLFHVVGDADRYEQALESVPDVIEADVRRIGEYDHTVPRGGQIDAVTACDPPAARELGSYEVPREASLEAVTNEIGVAPRTVPNISEKPNRGSFADSN